MDTLNSRKEASLMAQLKIMFYTLANAFSMEKMLEPSQSSIGAINNNAIAQTTNILVSTSILLTFSYC